MNSTTWTFDVLDVCCGKNLDNVGEISLLGIKQFMFY